MIGGVSTSKSAVSPPPAKLDAVALLLTEMLSKMGGPLTAKERKAADRALGRGEQRRS